MSKLLSLLAIAFALVISPLALAESMEEAAAQCKQWAQEENVSSDEMAAYMEDCIKTQTGEKADESK
jgi:uncharacterized protein YqfA (UPF0365 family)